MNKFHSPDNTWFSAQRNQSRIQQIFWALCMVFILGLFFSRVLLSASPVIMFLLVFVQKPHLKDKVNRLLRNRAALNLGAMFGLLALSVIYTEDKSNWVVYLHRYSVLLSLPFAGALLPKLSQKQVYSLLYFFVALTTGITMGTVIQYMSHFEAQNVLINQSQSPPVFTGFFHIHFGIIMALAIFFGVYIFQTPILLWRKAEKYLGIACAVILFVSIHLLAYRTGLLALYITAFIKLIMFVINDKRYLFGGVLVVILLTMPLVAYLTLPSVKIRVGNTRYDISRFAEQQDINNYSVSQRLAAWETAYAIIRHNWLLGVGPADTRLEMNQQYQLKDFGLKKENQVMVHNQYLHVLLGSGLIGLLVFLHALIFPFWQPASRKDYLVTTFLLVMSTAMLTDSYLELQTGLYLFVFFYTLFIVMQHQDR